MIHPYIYPYPSIVTEKRQTMLFSATQTRKTEDLARISLKKEPLYVGVDDKKDSATVAGLEQVDYLFVCIFIHLFIYSFITLFIIS